MEKLSKTERKKKFFNILSPYFTQLGYKKYLTSGDPGYVLDKEKIVIKFFFNFFSNEAISSGTISITHYEVENYILDFGFPNQDLIEHRKKEKYHLRTVSLRQIPESIKSRPLKTAKEIEEFAKAYIEFYENQGSCFIEKYSYLPNILSEIDKMETEGKNFKDLVSGTGDAFIRMLIISKLCNSPLYNERFERINSMMQNSAEWFSYWEKYKKVFEDIEPKYNLS